MDLAEAAEAVVPHTRAWPTGATVRVVAHQDADGVCAAAVATKWLARRGNRFHVTYTWNQDPEHVRTLLGQPGDPVVLLDLGAADASRLGERTTAGLIVDHHPPDEETAGGWVHLNPWRASLDGTSDASGATTMLALATADDERNWDLAPAALAGAAADRQDRPAFTGFNRTVAMQAQERGLLKAVRGLDLPDVPMDHLADHPTAVLGPSAGKWLPELAIPGHASPDELDANDRQRLASAFTIQRLREGAAPDEVLGLFVRRHVVPGWDDVPLRQAAGWIDAAARLGNAGVAVAFLLGDPDAKDELVSLHGRWESMVQSALDQFEASMESDDELRWSTVDEPRMVGVVATQATERLGLRGMPVVVVAKAEDHAAVSIRAPGRLGVDAGKAIGEAARLVGGTGGGHPVAAGARVPWDRLGEFRKILATRLKGGQ